MKRKTDNRNEKKELFENAARKMLAKMKRTALLAFAVICAAILISGFVLVLCNVRDETGFLFGIVIMPLAGFIMLLGLILSLTIPKRYSYEKYRRHMRRGYITVRDSFITQCIEAEYAAKFKNNRAGGKNG